VRSSKRKHLARDSTVTVVYRIRARYDHCTTTLYSAGALCLQNIEGEKVNGEPCWTRTSDHLIKSQMLYHLS
jgi:hypothetical protein